MPIPEFVVDLRRMVGTHELWLSGVTAVVVRDDAVLLVRRADSGEWTPVTGIVDPGEEPADAAAREVAEEAAVQAVPEHLAAIRTTGLVTYENGDRARYLDHVFRCRWVSGDPFPTDGENTEAAWFARHSLPPMTSGMTRRLRAGLRGATGCRFMYAGHEIG
ncbi:MAG: NUDIX domain-containing protein [Bifidobacteriaceae bacterium]|jgi:ADP-ribose pyrophosphatase YjhB (NUDIX family)|nr:NUDIX domain-containing protein [Bifidobacteriaceae bacterium]